MYESVAQSALKSERALKRSRADVKAEEILASYSIANDPTRLGAATQELFLQARNLAHCLPQRLEQNACPVTRQPRELGPFRTASRTQQRVRVVRHQLPRP